MRKTSTTKKKEILDSSCESMDSNSSFMLVEASHDPSKIKLEVVDENEFMKRSLAIESDGDHQSGIFNSS